MVSNDNPLEYRYRTEGTLLMTMRERSDTQVVFSAAESGNHPAGSIGAILSADQNYVYWENLTNPLP